jgi:hypothetical protein
MVPGCSHDYSRSHELKSPDALASCRPSPPVPCAIERCIIRIGSQRWFIQRQKICRYQRCTFARLVEDLGVLDVCS